MGSTPSRQNVSKSVIPLAPIFEGNGVREVRYGFASHAFCAMNLYPPSRTLAIRLSPNPCPLKIQRLRNPAFFLTSTCRSPAYKAHFAALSLNVGQSLDDGQSSLFCERLLTR